MGLLNNTFPGIIIVFNESVGGIRQSLITLNLSIWIDNQQICNRRIHIKPAGELVKDSGFTNKELGSSLLLKPLYKLIRGRGILQALDRIARGAS